MHSAAQADCRFPALFQVLRHWAWSRAVNNAAAGTLNSLAYALLTLDFIHTLPPTLPPPPVALFITGSQPAAEALPLARRCAAGEADGDDDGGAGDDDDWGGRR